MLFTVSHLTGEVSAACLPETRLPPCQAPAVNHLWQEEGYRGDRERGLRAGLGTLPSAAVTHPRVGAACIQEWSERGIKPQDAWVGFLDGFLSP